MSVEKVEPIDDQGTTVAWVLRITVGALTIKDAFAFADSPKLGKLSGLAKVPFGAVGTYASTRTPKSVPLPD